MKFTPRSEETRQFIIERAALIFNKKGYAGTSLSDLTSVTQLTKGSIYGNFENKDALALAVFEYNAAQKNAVVSEQLNTVNSWREKLLMYVQLFGTKKNHLFIDGGCPLMNTGVEADDTHEELRKKVGDEVNAWRKELVSILRKGIAAGEFKKGIDEEQFALSLIAIIEGAVFVARVTRKKSSLDNILETAKELINNISL